nr:hypothetical protein [Tanacetum cinerariifolium]
MVNNGASSALINRVHAMLQKLEKDIDDVHAMLSKRRVLDRIKNDGSVKALSEDELDHSCCELRIHIMKLMIPDALSTTGVHFEKISMGPTPTSSSAMVHAMLQKLEKDIDDVHAMIKKDGSVKALSEDELGEDCRERGMLQWRKCVSRKICTIA